MRRMSSLYLLISVVVVLYCHGAPISDAENPAEVIELSSDVEVLRNLFNGSVEVFDKETLLLYKADAVYQISVPQTAVETSEVLVNTESPLGLLKSLESMSGSSKRIALEEFTALAGIKENAQLVFDDWDLNDDGFLDQRELLQEEIKEQVVTSPQ